AETARLAAWNDAKPPLTLQPARWDLDTLRARLREAGFGVGEAPYGAGLRPAAAPGARLPPPARLPGFAEGGFIVQDAAQALVCRYAAVAATVRRAAAAVRVVVADLMAPPFAGDAFPAVFVDAPCTATGTMARHPDARWRLSPGAIARAAERQGALLAAAARLVRPGGLLIYATCSLEPEEN